MNNISQYSNCYGCSVCQQVCPRNIIEIVENNSGFYQPQISKSDDCIDCGRCLKVCSMESPILQTNDNVKGYASWSKEDAVRRKSSSGGTGFEIARHMVTHGYKVLGVRYNAEKQRAEHYIASTVEELVQSMGSKYLQSFTAEAFKHINKGEKYLVTGTPCQIASIRKMLRLRNMEDNVVLMDFFCHGVPSKLMWNKYIQELEREIGKVTYASWRNKQSGWHDSWAIGLDGDKNGERIDWHESYSMLIREKKSFYTKKRSEGDLFYKFFLGDMCFNKSCYKNCQFKSKSCAADIRIGDLWGTAYEDNDEGVTGILSFTEKGDEILHKSNIYLKEEPINVVIEGQQSKRIKMPYYYNFLIKLLRSSLPLFLIYKIVQVLRIGTILKYKLHLK